MNDSRLVVALDVGGHAARALVFDASGAEQARAERPVATRSSGLTVEHDADQLVDAVQEALDEACSGLGADAVRIVGAGLATQRASIVCVDRDTGRALSPVISWQDRRAADWLAAQALDAESVRRETGLPLSPHYGAGKMRWCLDHLDAVRAASAAGKLGIGPLSSFLTLRLCRDRPWIADPCNATRTQLWSLVERDWSPSLPACFGIPRDILPRTVPNRGAFGMLTTRGHPLPLVVVTGDQSAVPFACGVPDPDTLYVNIGTGAFLQRLCDGAQAPVAGLLRSVLWQEDNVLRFSDEGTVNGAGAALQAEADHAGLSADAMQAQLETWLAQTGDPPLFLNGVAGLGSPWWVADFPSRHVGSGDKPARCVAIVESIAFLVQRNLDALAAAGAAPRSLTLTGGLAHLDGLCRRIANLSGLDVLRPDLAEATARGLAFLVAGAPPHWTPPAVCRFDAQPDLHLRSRYERWRQLMESEVLRLRTP